MRLTNIRNADVRMSIIEVSKLKQAIEMAEAVQPVLVESTSKKARKSYSREKLKVLKYYHDNGKNLYKTCKRSSKSVMRWVKAKKIRGSSKGSE